VSLAVISHINVEPKLLLRCWNRAEIHTNKRMGLVIGREECWQEHNGTQWDE